MAFLLPLVGHSSPTFDYMFYCSAHLSTDSFPWDCADTNKNAFISLSLHKGRHVLNIIIFSSFLCEGVIRWLPRERVCVCVSPVAVFPPAEHNLLELHTQTQRLFLLHPRAARRFFRLSTCVSRVTVDLRFQTLPELHILLLFSPPFGKRHLRALICYEETPHYKYQWGSNKPIT